MMMMTMTMTTKMMVMMMMMLMMTTTIKMRMMLRMTTMMMIIMMMMMTTMKMMMMRMMMMMIVMMKMMMMMMMMSLNWTRQKTSKIRRSLEKISKEKNDRGLRNGDKISSQSLCLCYSYYFWVKNCVKCKASLKTGVFMNRPKSKTITRGSRKELHHEMNYISLTK